MIELVGTGFPYPRSALKQMKFFVGTKPDC